MPYEIKLAKPAQRFLAEKGGLTPKQREQIRAALIDLENDPTSENTNVAQLGPPLAPAYRYKAGAFRLIYIIKNDARLVRVLLIDWRRDIYQHARRLPRSEFRT